MQLIGKSPLILSFMESIRININKQQGRDGLVPIIAYPASSAYDFRLLNRSSDMANIATNSAYCISIYPDGQNMQVSLIKTFDGGQMEYSVLTDTGHNTIQAGVIMQTLKDLAALYEKVAAKEVRPSENKQFTDNVAAIYKRLTAATTPGQPTPLPVCAEDDALTYYMNYRTEGEIHTLLQFPDQEFFNHTSHIYLLDENVHPVKPQACKHIHSLVLRTFKIKSPQGYEYGEVKEGETVRINLKGKEGMLPMTADVKGDVRKPSPYGYFDSATNTIRIDERTVKFYYELKFTVRLNDRILRTCMVRYNGEQVMPDNNGSYLIKVYEDKVNNAGFIHFSGNNLKTAEIQVTPGIVKQQEYVYTPEPMHDLAHIVLDFSDGRPINAMLDIGTNDRLFNQLKTGKVKGYRVKKEGEEYRIFIPRKLSMSSKNILRMFKFIAMVLFTLAAYALAAWLMTKHWPWPIEQTVSPKATVTQTIVSPNGTIEEDDEDGTGLIYDERDQVALEALDFKYLNENDTWRIDSIKSIKYGDVLNTIFHGRLSEIKMKNYNAKVINNSWWLQVWQNIILANSVNGNNAKKAFDAVISDDHISLNVQQLYEELNKYVLPAIDGGNIMGAKPKPQPQPQQTQPQQQAQPQAPQSQTPQSQAQPQQTAPKTKQASAYPAQKKPTYQQYQGKTKKQTNQWTGK